MEDKKTYFDAAQNSLTLITLAHIIKCTSTMLI
jgi:hypothetical protein